MNINKVSECFYIHEDIEEGLVLDGNIDNNIWTSTITLTILDPSAGNSEDPENAPSGVTTQFYENKIEEEEEEEIESESDDEEKSENPNYMAYNVPKDKLIKYVSEPTENTIIPNNIVGTYEWHKTKDYSRVTYTIYRDDKSELFLTLCEKYLKEIQEDINPID